MYDAEDLKLEETKGEIKLRNLRKFDPKKVLVLNRIRKLTSPNGRRNVAIHNVGPNVMFAMMLRGLPNLVMKETSNCDKENDESINVNNVWNSIPDKNSMKQFLVINMRRMKAAIKVAGPLLYEAQNEDVDEVVNVFDPMTLEQTMCHVKRHTYSIRGIEPRTSIIRVFSEVSEMPKVVAEVGLTHCQKEDTMWNKICLKNQNYRFKEHLDKHITNQTIWWELIRRSNVSDVWKVVIHDYYAQYSRY